MSSLVPTSDYHSALKPPVPAPTIDLFNGDRIVAFTYDLMSAASLPAIYGQCDVLVADLPWQSGFGTFNARADIEDGRTYSQFMARVSEIVESATVPVFLVTGKHAKAKLPKADAELPTRLNEDVAVIYAYRPGAEADGRYGVAQELLFALASRYDAAGDFCCGYGRTARTFLRSGRRAVVSDVNPQCIGYIAEHAAEWAR